ncbi:MAG: Rpn family recombination-promoting nuclease/putative transposase [Lachnospiraceae bacterium]|nr:Rpn family recombination-promoting nuclease/putative transposase [Lachnospiraceae bacterium]
MGYNLEMQNEDEHNLPKRSRFHQAEMDATSLKPSEGFSELKPSYVIFICTFDPFSHGLYRYTFENRCLEKDFPLEDGTKKIFLNTRGKDPSGVPALLVHFLHYVENTTAALAAESGESKISVIHERVTGLKRSRRWEGRYMLLGEYIDREVKRGVREETEAMAERLTEEVTERVTEEVTERVTEEVTERVTGEVTEKVTKEITEAVTKEATETATQRLLTLIGKMLADGRAEEVSRLSGEPEFLEKIWKEYQL